jgi:hypothetical protein
MTSAAHRVHPKKPEMAPAQRQNGSEPCGNEGGASMRGVVMHSAGDVRVEDREDPTIVDPTDAVVRLSATCICGSDLWPYRGVEKLDSRT